MSLLAKDIPTNIYALRQDEVMHLDSAADPPKEHGTNNNSNQLLLHSASIPTLDLPTNQSSGKKDQTDVISPPESVMLNPETLVEKEEAGSVEECRHESAEEDSDRTINDSKDEEEENKDSRNSSENDVSSPEVQVQTLNPAKSHERTDSLSSSLSLGSLSLQSASLASFEVTSGDSGLGDSKRSSLDRKSQLSADSGKAVEEEIESSNSRRRGIILPTITLPKGLFTRKSNSDLPSSASSSNAWRIFQRGTHNGKGEVSSTTSLIFEDRPAHLPAKTEEEAAKHRKQFEQMVEAAKKREAQEAKKRRKAEEQRRKMEEQVSNACRFWLNEIIPRWEEMRNTRKSRELWWEGIPPSVRGRVWHLAIGNELNLTSDLYEICAARAKEKIASSNAPPTGDDAQCKETGTNGGDQAQSRSPSQQSFAARIRDSEGGWAVNREGTVELVHLDVARTFPSLGIFQQGGPYYDLLLNLLGAYVCYRPDVGYVQGMSFLAAVLLLNMESHEAFIAFANLLNRPLQLAFFRLRRTEMTHYFIAFDLLFKQELPRLHAHLDTHDVRPDLYLIEWLYTMYAKSLPLDVTCRVWDVYLRDGDDFLFRTAIGILSLHQDFLLASEFDECVKFLTHLPETLSSQELFAAIEAPSLSSSGERKGFDHFLAHAVHSLTVPGSPSFAKGHARKPSESSLASIGSSHISRGLSGVLGDWLASAADK